jgi:mono/diheme cytochrome c family protein
MKTKFIAPLVLAAFLYSCGGNNNNNAAKVKPKVKSMVEEPKPASKSNEEVDPISSKGVGPVKSLDLPEQIDQALAAKGEELFKANCTACHKIEKRLVGPALKGITERRTPEWIMNMILNPENMVNEDPIAKQLLAEYSAPMSNQSLTEEEARAILEYFRTLK